MLTDDNQYKYTAFGIDIQSTIPLSGFLSHVPNSPDRSETDLTVKLGFLPQRSEDLGFGANKVYSDNAEGVQIYRLQGGFFLSYQGVGSLVVETNEITVSPNPAADQDSVKWLVTNLGLRLALVARGAVVFHASAVVIDDTLVSFTGPSGRGKSTVAAACYASGHVHHSDDLVPVFPQSSGEASCAPPGPPRLRVNADVVPSLELSPPQSKQTDRKVRIDTSARHSTRYQAIDVLYLIEDAESIAINEVPAHDAVLEILRQSYALYRDSDTDSARAHFERCSQLARSMSVRTLSRPRSLQRLQEVVSSIEEDVLE